MLTRERIRELIDQHGLNDRADEIMAEVRSSIHLTLQCDVDEADIPVGMSKMGGSPDVPEGFEFPKWNYQPLSLIAQIRLSDAKPYDLEELLPEGMLYFFYNNFQYIDHIHQMDKYQTGPWRVVYLREESGLSRLPHPVSKQESFDTYRGRVYSAETDVYKACPIVFEQEWIPLSEAQPGTKQRPLALPSAEHDRYWGSGEHEGWWFAVKNELAEPMHRLLGVETDIQYNFSMMEDASDIWNLETPEDWMLLLQADSGYSGEAKPGFQWDDGGNIYFLIHKDDLQAQRFDRVWLYFTSY